MDRRGTVAHGRRVRLAGEVLGLGDRAVARREGSRPGSGDRREAAGLDERLGRSRDGDPDGRRSSSSDRGRRGLVDGGAEVHEALGLAGSRRHGRGLGRRRSAGNGSEGLDLGGVRREGTGDGPTDGDDRAQQSPL